MTTIGSTISVGSAPAPAVQQQPAPAPSTAGVDYMNTLRGPKVMLLGEIGCGKTWSLRTLLKQWRDRAGVTHPGAGFKLAVIFTEPGMSSLADCTCEDGFHFKYIPAAAPSWDSLIKSTKMMTTMTMKDLSNLDGIDKSQYQQFVHVYMACANFTCDRCGTVFGPIDKLSPSEWAVGLDSISGLSTMAMNLVIGSKPIRSKDEWYRAQDQIERLVNVFTNSVLCPTVMLSHIDREPNELTGADNLTISTLGKALAPKIIKPFNDIIHVKRKENTYVWSTITPNMTLKTQNLSYADNLQPSFVPLIENWRAKGGAQAS